MKRKALSFINLILGILATIFAGCHIGKKVSHESEPVCMYAGPGQMGELNVRMDESTPQQSDIDAKTPEYIEPEEQKAPDEPTPVKYGPLPR